MKKSYQFFILLIIYFLTLGIRIYWLTQKEGFNVDEGLSVTLSCYNDYMWKKNYDFNREYTGKEVKEISLCDNDSFRNVLGDIRRLWRDNRDSPHTNLYYSFLRLSLAGLKTGDIKTIIIRGGILNLIFFSISFISFFLFIKILFPDKKLLQLIITACAFLSTATISNTLFLRPYQIQETLFIIFCYYFYKTLELKKYILHENILFINTKLLFPFSLITAFTLLTGYYSIIFIGLIGLYVIYKNNKTKNYYEIMFYIFVLIVGLVTAQTFYSGYFHGYISARVAQTRHTLFENILVNVKSSIFFAGAILQKHFFSYPVIIICALCLAYILFSKQKLKINISIFCFIVSILYLFIILAIAPFKILRYVMPVFPFFAILPAIIINSIKNRKISFAIMLLFFIVFTKDSLNQNNIENLYQNKPDLYTFSKDTAVPVFVINHSFWRYADLVPYFNDEQLYFFIDNHEDIFLKGYNEFYIVVNEILEMPDIDLTKFEIEQDFTVSYFKCRKIRIIST